MEDSGAAPAATSHAGGWRPFWMPAGLVLFLVFLTANVVAGGPLVALDRHIRRAVQGPATSATWRWLTNGGLARRSSSPIWAPWRWPARCSP